MNTTYQHVSKTISPLHAGPENFKDCSQDGEAIQATNHNPSTQRPTAQRPTILGSPDHAGSNPASNNGPAFSPRRPNTALRPSTYETINKRRSTAMYQLMDSEAEKENQEKDLNTLPKSLRSPHTPKT